MKKRRIGAVASSAVVFGLLVAALWPGWGAGRVAGDIGVRVAFASRRPVPVSDRITLVEIDNDAISTLGRWPWERATGVAGGAVREGGEFREGEARGTGGASLWRGDSDMRRGQGEG